MRWSRSWGDRRTRRGARRRHPAGRVRTWPSGLDSPHVGLRATRIAGILIVLGADPRRRRSSAACGSRSRPRGPSCWSAAARRRTDAAVRAPRLACGATVLREDTQRALRAGLHAPALRAAGVASSRSSPGTPTGRSCASRSRRRCAVAEDERRTWWMFRGRFFWEDDGLAADEVMALVHERERRLRRRIDRAKDMMLAEAPSAGPAPRADPGGRAPRGLPPRRRPLRGLRRRRAAAVRPRDPGGARRRLDPGNLQLLCAPCNREKGAGLS